MRRYFVAVILFATSSSAAFSADAEFFEARIRPVLVEQCYACHNSTESAEAELAVDFRQGLRSGGTGGALIVPGDPEKSRLIAILKHQIEGLEMPQDSGKLDDVVIADFEKWIADGAIDPRERPPTAEQIEQATSWDATLQRRKQWWSFQPLKQTELPEGNANPIDQLIRSKLDEVGLLAAGPAEPEVLIRRLYLTLIGIPPTPEELRSWLNRFSDASVVGLAKRSPNSHAPQEVSLTSTTTEALIDHLLASKQFGPRWARHWMDWIRYAESHGSEGDPVMQNAWMYRDYLIRALNQDIPYDQLVTEHLAGDLIDNPRINQELGVNESLLGTIQLRMVFHGFSPTDALDEKVRFVDDQVNAVSKAFLGLTVSCARCHDHKFDAISQTDYYAMFGMFAACRPGRSIADAPERLLQHVQELIALKPKICDSIAAHWLDTMPTITHRITEKLAGDLPDHSLLSVIKNWKQWEQTRVPATDRSSIVRGWNLGDANDFSTWYPKGIDPKPTGPGEYAVALSGDQAIQGVYPCGVYSHLLSTKHPLRLTSPDVVLDGKYDYWVRAIGGDDSATRYVTQDYPRTGTVFQATPLSGSWTWHKLKLDYWEGDSAHFEISTGPDIPLQASNKPRSWFGASEVRMVPHNSPAPENRVDFITAIAGTGKANPESTIEAQSRVIDAIDQAVRAWQADACSNSQSLLIDQCIREGLLENRLNSLPTVKPLVEQYRKLEAAIVIPRRVPGLDDVPQRTQPLFVRGNHKQPAEVVPRRFLQAIDDQPYPATETGRRQFAKDLLRDDNPLPRRVIANRLWHHLFGRGIVATPDNFGRLGSLPTHPELLDWLANRFVEDGWSLKKMIRLIVTSETWQQSSQPSDKSRQLDPDNLYLSHAPIRRLEAEAIRDAMLTAAGSIELELQGEPVDGTSNRRSIFIRVHRNALDPMLRVFDFPEPHTAMGRREATNVPAQSLLMMNSPQIAEYANRLADQLLGIASATNDRDRIDELYLRTLSRLPSESESKAMLKYRSQNAVTLKELRVQRDGLQRTISAKQTEMDAIVQRKREQLSKQPVNEPKPSLVHPYAHWDFEAGFRDQAGDLNGEAKAGAKIADGRLVVNHGGYGTTVPLTKSIQAKTLEAWVQLDNLDQQGGGVITIQTGDGGIFDAIVFAERQKRRWMAGSDGFQRTQDFDGAIQESQAIDTLVHLAISYHSDGTIVGYRDGKRYGKPYKTSPPVEFRKGDAVVSFGVRHFPNEGNHRLAGSIARANLYDHALSDQEISESFAAGSDQVSDLRVIEALPEAEQVLVKRLRTELEQLAQSIEALGTIPDQYSQQVGWADLARTMFMLKEFIYVR